MTEATIDPHTGRPLGDHGTAQDAIDYVLGSGALYHEVADVFLTAWREGNLGEWPEFYAWLKAKGR